MQASDNSKLLASIFTTTAIVTKILTYSYDLYQLSLINSLLRQISNKEEVQLQWIKRQGLHLVSKSRPVLRLAEYIN